MFRFKVYQVIIHIAGWLLFMAFPLLFINAGQGGNIYLLLKAPSYWLFCFAYISLFYFNAYLLIPGLFLKKKYVWYAIISLLLFAGVYLLKPYDRLLRNTEKSRHFLMEQSFSPMGDRLSGHYIPPPPHSESMQHHDKEGLPGPPRLNADRMPGFGPRRDHFMRPFDSVSFFLFLMIMALSTAIKIIQQWQLTEQRATRAEADKASAELSSLKAQINPHFLFNTLNNIYTLTVMKDDNAPDSIMKLSNIMRYVTDDAVEDLVPLQSEIDCIHDYIELQRLRLSDKTRVNLDISGSIEHKKIAPLILMTFIENVFKYGISKHNLSSIDIKLSGDENGIYFFCQNKIFPEKEKNRRVGIGIKNTRQRLTYLYPNKYILDISTENQLYTVELTLRTS